MTPPRVLLVDDSELIHTLVRMQFVDEMIELRSAFNGKTALDLAECIRPDLILLDVDMPGMDGFEVCHRLRESPLNLYTPVIFLTCVTESVKIVRGLDLGAVDYITKPFDATILVARVRAALRVKQRMDFLGSRRVQNFISDATADPVAQAA